MKKDLKEMYKYFEREYPLNKDGLEESISLFKTVLIKKGVQILKSGSKEKELRFLNKGVLREYYANSEKETNINFYVNPQFITDISSLINDYSTHKNQESLTNIEILTINKQVYFELLERYQCGKSLIDLSFQKLLRQKEILEYNRITKTADELYKDLLSDKPKWLEKIPQYHIASYLGITPETLSRIRKRIS